MKWQLAPNKYMSSIQVRKLRAMSETMALADSAKGRSTWIRIHMMIDLATSSGLRVAEMAGLKVKDLNLKTDPCMNVTGKGNKMRIVFIGQDLKRHL